MLIYVSLVVEFFGSCFPGGQVVRLWTFSSGVSILYLPFQNCDESLSPDQAEDDMVQYCLLFTRALYVLA